MSRDFRDVAPIDGQNSVIPFANKRLNERPNYLSSYIELYFELLVILNSDD